MKKVFVQSKRKKKVKPLTDTELFDGFMKLLKQHRNHQDCRLEFQVPGLTMAWGTYTPHIPWNALFPKRRTS
jgi:hypothetical protein